MSINLSSSIPTWLVQWPCTEPAPTATTDLDSSANLIG